MHTDIQVFQGTDISGIYNCKNQATYIEFEFK